MIEPGEVIPYLEMCGEEGTSLQRGMNFQLNGGASIFLMSQRKGAPYEDKVENEGKTLIYEGHDVSRVGEVDPKKVDQPMKTNSGKLTPNGLFFNAAKDYKAGKKAAEKVKVYEKIQPGIWVFNGIFNLVDAEIEKKQGRKVFKFKLNLIDDSGTEKLREAQDLEHNRLIPTSVKLDVWKRDKGQCVKCGSKDNLHFDHIIPYSKGGSSLTQRNIQILCARHNLQKHDSIE